MSVNIENSLQIRLGSVQFSDESTGVSHAGSDCTFMGKWVEIVTKLSIPVFYLESRAEAALTTSAPLCALGRPVTQMCCYFRKTKPSIKSS